MDNRSQEIINIGERFIKMMTEAPSSPFDFSNKSIEYLQGVISSLKESQPDSSYQTAVRISSALYIAKVLTKNFPNLQLKILFDDINLVDLQVTNDKTTLNILSWVDKSIENPEGEDIVFKFQKAQEHLQNSI